MNFHKNHFLLFNMAFWGFVVLTLLIAIGPAVEALRIPPTPGLKPLTPQEQRGRDLYVSEGCSYCHTQQVRPVAHDRVFGRPSAAGDYYYATPQLLGTERTGPDLANIGNRQPDETWHLIHLYNPRAVVKQSVMPAFWWYFEVKEKEEPGDVVVPVPPPYGPPGKVAVASRDALAIVAYLQSLKQPPLDMRAFGATSEEATPTAVGAAPSPSNLAALGPQVYEANCARCHQSNGEGLIGLYPSLRGDPVVTARDPEQHIRTVLFGLQDKKINDKQYPGKMPAFGEVLSDEEIAAVISHERTSWGNLAPTVTPEDVKKARLKP